MTATLTPPPPQAAVELPEESTGNDWFDLVRRIKKSNPLLGAILEQTILMERTAQHIKIGLHPSVAFLSEKLKQEENLTRLKQFMETFWNENLEVQVTVSQDEGGSTARAHQVNANETAASKLEAAVKDHPAVKSVQNIFKTQIKSIQKIQKEKA